MLNDEQLDMIKRLQPLFKEKMGEWLEGDAFHNPFRHKLYYVDSRTIIIEGCYFIPQFHDQQNPNRGLWGMLNSQGKRWLRKSYFFSDFLELDDPFTALLKALCEQEGV